MRIRLYDKRCEIQSGERSFYLDLVNLLYIRDELGSAVFIVPEWLATAIREAFEKEISTNMNRGA